MSDFADRLNALFAAFRPSAGDGQRPGEWPNRAVAQVAAELLPSDDKPLTRQYLGMLRSGERPQPSLRAANAIAWAFSELSSRSGTPCHAVAILNYLANGTATAADTPEDLRATLCEFNGTAGQSGDVALLARGGADVVSPGSLRDVNALIEQLARKDAAPVRQRLARILGVRTPGGGDHARPGQSSDALDSPANEETT